MEKRKILAIILTSFTLIFAFLAWQSIKNAVILPYSSTWVAPIIFFSLYIIFICLDIIVLKELLFLEFLLISSLSVSFLFAFSRIQLGAVLISGYLLFLASRKIQEDMEQNLKINIWKSLQVGKTFLLLSISFLIAAQYYFVVNNFEGEKKVPHFDASFVTKKIAIPFLSIVNPQFKVLNDETLTVDQFILQTQDGLAQDNELSQENQQLLDSKIPADLPATQRELLKKQALDNYVGTQAKLLQQNQDIVLKNGHSQLAEMAGVPISGNEKISDVFTGLISNKINDYFNPKASGTAKNSAFAIILAIVLFLTIYPMGSILSVFWFLLIKLIMFWFLKSKLLKVRIVTVSKEIME